MRRTGTLRSGLAPWGPPEVPRLLLAGTQRADVLQEGAEHPSPPGDTAWEPRRGAGGLWALRSHPPFPARPWGGELSLGTPSGFSRAEDGQERAGHGRRWRWLPQAGLAGAGRAEPGRSRAAGEPCPVLVTGSSVIQACRAGCHGVSQVSRGVTGVSEPCSAVWCHPVVCCAVLSCAVPCSAKPCRAKLCRARAQQLDVPWAGGSTDGAVDGSDSPGTFPLAKGTWPGGAPSCVPLSLAVTPRVWSCHWCCRTGVGTRLPWGRGALGPLPLYRCGSPARARVPGTASPRPRPPGIPPASPRQRARWRGWRGAAGLPAEQRPWRGPAEGGAAERQRLFPAPAPRKRVGGQEGRPAAGPSAGTGRAPGRPGGAAPWAGSRLPLPLPGPAAVPERQHREPSELGSGPNQVGERRQGWSRGANFGQAAVEGWRCGVVWTGAAPAAVQGGLCVLCWQAVV